MTTASEKDDILSSLNVRAPSVPVAPGYAFAVMLVAFAMLVLVATYLGLTVGLAVYIIYAVTHLTTAFAWAGPVIGPTIGLATVAFALPLWLTMLKPLFVPRDTGMTPHVLEEKDAPDLFILVERLCLHLGAPMPKRIEVDVDANASAATESGIIGFIRGDCILTLGLPLVASQSVKQLTGVIAHEMGHFRQGTMRRMRILIYRIQEWFDMVVDERDVVDEWLWRRIQAEPPLPVVLVLLAIRTVIFVNHVILLMLNYLSHICCCQLSRQAEFDADQYFVRVVGADEFRTTMEGTESLGFGTQRALSELNRAFADRLTIDDMPRYIARSTEHLPKDLREEVAKSIHDQETGLFDTHPPKRERIARAQATALPGLDLPEYPATELFIDFAGLSRRLTRSWYKEILGHSHKDVREISCDDMLASNWRRDDNAKAVWRYFQTVIPSHLPVTLEMQQATRLAIPGSRSAERLADSREQMIAMLPEMEAAFKRYGGRRKVFQAIAEGKTFPESGLFSEYRELGSLRLEAALNLAVQSHIAEQLGEDPAELKAEVEAMTGPLVALGIQLSTVHAIASHYDGTVVTFINFIRMEQPTVSALGAVTRELRKLRQNIIKANRVLDHLPYPFPHSGDELSCSTFLMRDELPEEDDLFALMFIAGIWIDNFSAMYYRVLGRLVMIAERVEKLQGLDPLADPDLSVFDDEESLLDVKVEDKKAKKKREKKEQKEKKAAEKAARKSGTPPQKPDPNTAG